jgi:hypothetical protein
MSVQNTLQIKLEVQKSALLGGAIKSTLVAASADGSPWRGLPITGELVYLFQPFMHREKIILT